MARKKAHGRNTDREMVFWYLASAYVADAVGLFDPAQRQKLSQLMGDADWQADMRQHLAVDDSLIRGVCAQRGTAEGAIRFILGGLGCPDAGYHARCILA